MINQPNPIIASKYSLSCRHLGHHWSCSRDCFTLLKRKVLFSKMQVHNQKMVRKKTTKRIWPHYHTNQMQSLKIASIHFHVVLGGSAPHQWIFTSYVRRFNIINDIKTSLTSLVLLYDWMWGRNLWTQPRSYIRFRKSNNEKVLKWILPALANDISTMISTKSSKISSLSWLPP